jgi:general secretion pathway protein D
MFKAMNWNHLRIVSALAMVALLAAPALEAKNRKAEKFFKDGQTAENKGNWDDALRLYRLAVDQEPKDPEYLIAMRRAQFQAGQMHVENGLKLRQQGKLAEAMQQFQTALIDDPSSAIAIQEIRRTQQMIDQQRKGEVKPDEANLTPVERIRRQDDERVESMQGPPQLKPMIRQIPPLKMNNQPPRILYETVGKLAGINVVLDSQYQAPPRGFTVEMGNSTVEQAFDQLAVLTHTYWKPISSNTIFVTEDNATKRRDYEDQVVKVFYVTNATSVQEFQEIATAIRTVADIRRVYTYNAQKAMVVRGTVDQVALAEKLVRDLDKPKAEVVCELIFMQVSSSVTRNLSASLVNAATGTAGLNVPFAFTPSSSIAVNSTSTSSSSSTSPTTSTTASTASTTASTSGPVSVGLNSLSHLSSSDFSTSLPGALLQATLTDASTKVLSKPELRVSDGMKAELQIGDRIPYATGSFSSGLTASASVSPLVSTQFQFADTGTTMIIQPQVHSATEVTLHVEITVSSVQEYLTIGGTGGLSQPVIAQNKSITDLRLRDGEVNILGGLDQVQDSLTVNGIPGLVNIPALGSTLFGSQTKEKDNSQLLIALIPHIVRTPDYTEENLKGIFAGWEQTPKVIYAPRPDEPAAPGAALGGNAAPQANQAANAALPAAPPAAAPPKGAPSAPAPGPPAAPPPSPGVARLSLLPSPVQAAPNAEFTVTVRLDNANDLFSVSPLRIKFDPAQVRLNDVVLGDMMGPATLEKDIRNDSGDAIVTLTRAAGSSGVNGSGVLATLRFMAVAPGSGNISITEATVKNPQSQVLPAGVSSVPVTIR